MSLLTAADRADLLATFTEAQPDTTLTLYRPQNDGSYTTIPAQEVQVAYAARQPRTGGMVGVDETRADVTFYRESPFDVRVDDVFELDGHRGGRITGVHTDPVLGVIVAEGSYETGRQ